MHVCQKKSKFIHELKKFIDYWNVIFFFWIFGLDSLFWNGGNILYNVYVDTVNFVFICFVSLWPFFWNFQPCQYKLGHFCSLGRILRTFFVKPPIVQCRITILATWLGHVLYMSAASKLSYSHKWNCGCHILKALMDLLRYILVKRSFLLDMCWFALLVDRHF